MAKASWNGVLLAESDIYEKVEGNIYFPPGSIVKELFINSPTHTTCPWKGTAGYYTIVVNGKQNVDAAWYYPETKEAAAGIKEYIAFWRGVEVSE